MEISTSTIFIVQHTLSIFPVFTITAFEKQITPERKIARSRTREIGKTEIKKEGHSDTANVVEQFASNLHLFLSLLVSSFPSFLFRLRPLFHSLFLCPIYSGRREPVLVAVCSSTDIPLMDEIQFAFPAEEMKNHCSKHAIPLTMRNKDASASLSHDSLSR